MIYVSILRKKNPIIHLHNDKISKDPKHKQKYIYINAKNECRILSTDATCSTYHSVESVLHKYISCKIISWLWLKEGYTVLQWKPIVLLETNYDLWL